MGDMTIGVMLFLLILAILIFLALRELWCWYWKINARMRQLDLINDNLNQIKRLLMQNNAGNNHMSNNDSKDDSLPKL